MLPKGWEVKKLGDVFKTSSGGTPLKSNVQYYQNGTIPWLLSGEVCQKEINVSKNFITQLGLDSSSAKIFPTNSVLIAMYGATAGQVGILRFPAASNQAVCAIYPNEKTNVNFIYYFFLYAKDKLVAQAVGNAQPNISQQKIKDTLTPIPPLSEQRRIVEILDQAFAGIDTAIGNTQQAINNAKELFDTELNRIFSQRGEGWEEKELGKLGNTMTGSTPPTTEKANFGQYMPFIKPADFNLDGTLKYDNFGLSEQGALLARKIAPNSILMVCIGATIGKCGWCDREVAANQQINVLTPLDNTSHKFIYYQMLMRNFQHKVIFNAGQATLPIINKAKWISLTVWLPRLPEQQRIVAKLDQLKNQTQALTAVYQQKLAALQELKQSLLHKAFTGELTADWQASG